MHWLLSGFHYSQTFFGSWPAMIAVVGGLFCASWAARCRAPVACGAVAGVSILFNATVVPGVAVVCVALLATSGASFRQGVRWAATTTAATVAVSGWWLVPFLAGWDRLVRWEVPFSTAWGFAGVWGAGVLVALGAAAGWSARRGAGPSRRLALVAAVALLATLFGDLVGYLRPERWLQLAILVATISAGGLVRHEGRQGAGGRARPVWAFLAVAAAIIFVVISGRLEILPVTAWLLWWPRRVWAAAAAAAWVSVLIWVPLWDPLSKVTPPSPDVGPLEAVATEDSHDQGLVYLDHRSNTVAGDVQGCPEGQPWHTTSETDGRVRPLLGLYVETSQTAEFLVADGGLRGGQFVGSNARRPDWFEVWEGLGEPSLDAPGGAEALGARWFVECDSAGELVVTELAGTLVSGVSVVPFVGDGVWHRAAVEWWLPMAAGLESAGAGGLSVVPVLSEGDSDGYRLDQPAGGVVLDVADDVLTVRAERAGWAWVRVPWDPDWRSVSGTPVRKGGPGHLVVWVQEGETVLRWSVPRSVDVAAAGVTGASLLVVAALGVLNRRRGWEFDADRRKPAADALTIFADTVDRWAYTAATRTRELVQHTKQRITTKSRHA